MKSNNQVLLVNFINEVYSLIAQISVNTNSNVNEFVFPGDEKSILN